MTKSIRLPVAPAVWLDLQHGRYADYLHEYESGDLRDPLAVADFAVYLGHLDRAEAALLEAPRSDVRSVIAAELAIARGEYEDAHSLLEDLGLPRAQLNLARIAFKLGRWPEVVRLARQVEARSGDNLFLRGRAYALVATALDETGEGRAAGLCYRLAIADLEASEDLCYRAYAESFYGWWLASEGDVDGARRAHENARRVADRIGMARDLLTAEVALAQTDHLAGRYSEAAARARSLVGSARALGHRREEIWGLEVLAQASLALGRVGDATEAAAALPLVALADCEWSEIRAHILRARTAAHRFDRSSIAEWPAIVAAADRSTGAWHGAYARLAWWDALAATEPAAAEAHRSLTDAASESKFWLIRAELAAVAVTPRLVLRTSGGWEIRRDAVEIPPALPVWEKIARGLAVYDVWDSSESLEEIADKLGYTAKSHASRLLSEHGLKARRSVGRPRLRTADANSPKRRVGRPRLAE